jgi:hypothetical protein
MCEYRKTDHYRALARERRKKWVEKNPEKARANFQKWHDKKNADEHRQYNKQWRRDNPERVRAGWIRRRYGITLEQWGAMLISQSGLCAVCEDQLRDPHIDHDHACCPGKKACGKCVRGLLCFRCNVLLGVTTTPDVLLRAIDYLRLSQRLD